MVASETRDFQAVLNELIEEASDALAAEWSAAPPAAPDYLAAAEDVLFGNGTADSVVLEQYKAFDADDEFKLDLLRDLVGDEEPASPIDRDGIARELHLDGVDTAGLHRIRRQFAFVNHPDRVPAHMRHTAVVRMQVANMLIDEAVKARPA